MSMPCVEHNWERRTMRPGSHAEATYGAVALQCARCGERRRAPEVATQDNSVATQDNSVAEQAIRAASLNRMTKAQLIDVAAQRGITLEDAANMTKAQIIEALA